MLPDCIGAEQGGGKYQCSTTSLDVQDMSF